MPSDDLAALARRIAELGWVPWPGQAVRDPETGAVWRGENGPLPGRYLLPCNEPAIALTEVGDVAAQARAIPAGPDLTDEVTALSLLADLPEHDLSPFVSTCRMGSGFVCERRVSASQSVEIGTGSTRAEAIARAWIAAKEAADG